MAKALKNWELESPLGTVRIKFAQFTAKVVDANANLIPNHAPMEIADNYQIAGDIYDLKTKEFEGKGKIAIKSLDVLKFDGDRAIYFVETADNVRYYFNLWQSTYGMKQDLFKAWLKGLRPEDIQVFLK